MLKWGGHRLWFFGVKLPSIPHRISPPTRVFPSIDHKCVCVQAFAEQGSFVPGHLSILDQIDCVA